MFEKMPFWGQVALMVVLAVVIIGMAYFVWPNLKQDLATIEALEIEYQEKERQIREGQAIEANLPELEREIASLERKLEDIAVVLPTGQETGELLAWIKNLGDQSNLDLRSFAPQPMTEREFYKDFPIVMQITGKYHDLGLFLDRVSKYTRIINVDGLTINANTGNPDRTINANFTATTFVYDETNVGEGSIQ